MLGVKREEVIAMGAILLTLLVLAIGVLLTWNRKFPEDAPLYAPP
jgi:hypothetical protein